MTTLKGKERATEWLKQFKEGYSYGDIAKVENVSRTLVYQQLKKHCYEETQSVIKERKRITKNRTTKDFITITCLNCGKEIKTNYRYYEKKFCSKECRSEFTKTAFKMLDISKKSYFDSGK